MTATLRRTVSALLAVPGLMIIAWGLLWLALTRARPARPRLLWGTAPIKSLCHLSAALRDAGYDSETAVLELYPIVSPGDFDHLLFSQRPRRRGIGYCVNTLIAYRFFAGALSRYDIFHYFFDGGLLHRTALRRLEYPLLRRCGKRLVFMPYGSDAFVYDRLDPLWRHALLIDYPQAGNAAADVERDIRRATRYADIVVGCLVHLECLPRWDVLPLTCYPVDVDALPPRWPSMTGTVRIAHAPNHRGAKGSEFLLDAVDRLRAEGADVELVLIERRPHPEALALIASADLFVDQLVFGYALAALEAMALGKVVVSGLEPAHPSYRVFRRYSYLDECPIVPASPESIYDVLARLLERRHEWVDLGRQCRRYVERRHSYRAAQAMWQAVYARLWEGEEVDLMNFYHPWFEKGWSEKGWAEGP